MAYSDAALNFGAQLEEARSAAGSPSYRTVERAVYDRLGAHAPSHETIRAYHRGQMEPEKADILVVAALATVYKVTLTALSPVVAERARAHRDLLETLHTAWSVLLAGNAA